MKSALVFVGLVALCQGSPLLRGLGGRIVNGENAMEGEIPYQVSLQTMGGFHFCGGSVLNKNYVVTAAHCVKGSSPSSIKVIAGTTDLEDPQATHYAVKIIVHDGYNPYDSWVNDIALIKVDTDFHYSKTVSNVVLPPHGFVVPDSSVATVSGWGRLWQGGSTPTVLQRTDIMITSQQYCTQIYGYTGMAVYPTHICAHDRDVESGSCHGDSGGPLTVDGQLAGIVSWAQGCASTKYPTVYTRVAEYVDWLNANAV
ncbi:trypsin-1-like [Venturia canescens]|uniref:trypsin-1-like n=1 Tax=Venturia canescens TaxID=32260 RepID=UPI001C9CFB6E|nr:trypsin-1-like [Venturia canescens]